MPAVGSGVIGGDGTRRLLNSVSHGEEAKAAIDKVNVDTSMNPGTTLASLRDIRDHVDLLMDAIENDDSADAEE